jgi:hypothetical protein
LNPQETDLLSPPPFAFYEDDAFAADMTLLVPDERVRDDVVNSIGWTITHTLVGMVDASGISPLSGAGDNLIITQNTAVCPSLRVVYSVEDRPPTRRWISLRRAALRDQRGSAG